MGLNREKNAKMRRVKIPGGRVYHAKINYARRCFRYCSWAIVRTPRNYLIEHTSA